MPKTLIPTTLRQFTAGQSTVETSGSTVQEALASLVACYPELKKYLLTEEGKLKNVTRVYIDDEDIRALDNEQTPVQPHHVISIITAVAGG